MRKEYKHLSIDTISNKNMPNVRLVFHILKHYNQKGKGRNTASNYLINAYEVYKKPHNDKITEFMKDVYLMRYIVKEYHFYSKDVVYAYLEHNKPAEIEKIPAAARRTLSFDPDEEADMELYNLLSSLNNKARTLAITGIVLNYIRQGLDPYYLDFAGNQFVQNLVNEYHLQNIGGEGNEEAKKTFDEIIDMMLFLGTDGQNADHDDGSQNKFTEKERNVDTITQELLGV